MTINITRLKNLLQISNSGYFTRKDHFFWSGQICSFRKVKGYILTPLTSSIFGKFLTRTEIPTSRGSAEKRKEEEIQNLQLNKWYTYAKRVIRAIPFGIDKKQLGLCISSENSKCEGLVLNMNSLLTLTHCLVIAAMMVIVCMMTKIATLRMENGNSVDNSGDENNNS